MAKRSSSPTTVMTFFKALHLVSAWASDHRLVLAQVKVDPMSNEITAIPELLQLLDIKGCIITIDAMGAQKSIATQIIHSSGRLRPHPESQS